MRSLHLRQSLAVAITFCLVLPIVSLFGIATAIEHPVCDHQWWMCSSARFVSQPIRHTSLHAVQKGFARRNLIHGHELSMCSGARLRQR
jgi:hypothetical protein